MRRTWLAAYIVVLVLLIGVAACADVSTAPTPPRPASPSEPTAMRDPPPVHPSLRVLTGAAAESLLTRVADGATGDRREAIRRRVEHMETARAHSTSLSALASSPQSMEDDESPFGTAVILETNTMLGLRESLAFEAPSFVSPHIRYHGSRAKTATKFRLANRQGDTELLTLEVEHEGIGDVECWRLFQCPRTIYTMNPVIDIANTPLCGVKLSAGTKYQAWIEFPPVSIGFIRGVTIPTLKWGRVEAVDVADPDPGVACPSFDENDPSDGGGGGGGDGDDEHATLVCLDIAEGWIDLTTGVFVVEQEWQACWTETGPLSSFESIAAFAPAAPRGGPPAREAQSVLLFATGQLPGRARTQVHRFPSGDHRVVVAIDTTSATADDVGAALAGLAAFSDDPVGTGLKDQRLVVRSFTHGAAWERGGREATRQTLRSLSRAHVSSIRGIGTGRTLEINVTSSGLGRRTR